MMARVTLNDPHQPGLPPSAGGSEPSANPPPADMTTDSKGRRLIVRKLSTLEQMRLIKTLGPALSQNDRYFGLALLALSVRQIDDYVPAETFGHAPTERQLEAFVSMLGDEGIEAAAKHLQAVMETAEEVVASAKN